MLEVMRDLRLCSLAGLAEIGRGSVVWRWVPKGRALDLRDNFTVLARSWAGLRETILAAAQERAN